MHAHVFCNCVSLVLFLMLRLATIPVTVHTHSCCLRCWAYETSVLLGKEIPVRLSFLILLLLALVSLFPFMLLCLLLVRCDGLQIVFLILVCDYRDRVQAYSTSYCFVHRTSCRTMTISSTMDRTTAFTSLLATWRTKTRESIWSL